jgi:hypothetical protein
MSNSKEKRETFLSLKEGKNFRRKLYMEATSPNTKDMHPDDFLIALDELKKISGVTSK